MGVSGGKLVHCSAGCFSSGGRGADAAGSSAFGGPHAEEPCGTRIFTRGGCRSFVQAFEGIIVAIGKDEYKFSDRPVGIADKPGAGLPFFHGKFIVS